MTVLLGRNGAAKSNLLEAIITIFRDIDLGAKSSFGFEIEYEINDKVVLASAVAGSVATATVDGKRVKRDQLQGRFAPRFLVGYYSGLSDRFNELFHPHDNKALDETLKAADSVSELSFRKFINARPEHGLFALTSFFFTDDTKVTHFLSDLPKIEAFDSLLVVARKPPWARKGHGAESFWGAKGPVRVLLERLRARSLAPFCMSTRVNIDFRRTESRELMFLYIADMGALRDLASTYGDDPKSLFQAFDTMRLSSLLEDFRVRVKVRGANASIHTRELSEGEQQLLTVLGLMRFTRDDSSLYLLDEPDTHLNPSWGLEYLRRLREVGEIDKNSHTFIATHDPLLIAGLERDEIRVLMRANDGRIAAVTPEESPKGRGVAAALTSDLFGLESQLDLDAQDTLKQIYELIDKDDLNAIDRSKLEELRKSVPDLVPEDVEGDPYRALARRAYEEAQDSILDTQMPMDWKRSALDRLRETLVKEATNE